MKKKGRCDYMSEWGRCKQPADRRGAGTQLCAFHTYWACEDHEPDRAYHEKIVRGLLHPTWDYLSDVEVKTMMGGRFHGDGRRLDHYVVDDPVETQ